MLLIPPDSKTPLSEKLLTKSLDFSSVVETCRRRIAVSVDFIVKDTLTQCPNEKEVTFYYYHCMVSYSNQNILLTRRNTHGGYIMSNGHNISSNGVDEFVALVSSTMNKAAFEAASNVRKFYTIKANWDTDQNLYGLVQCTPDITRQDCLSCLQSSIIEMPLYKIGVTLLWPSCNARYELYTFYNESALFYNESAIRTSPPQLPASIPPVTTPSLSGNDGNSKVLVIAIVVPIIVVALLSIAGYYFLTKRAKKTYDTAAAFDGDDITTIESLQLDYRTIQAATNYYSENNKIGQGGFGEVYKGTFSNGTEVAVKILSKSSEQGDTEFKNEVVVVAKLQHRNLVRLLGFSVQGEERILVYEYVPHKSLNYFLFDPSKQVQLDWAKRYKKELLGGFCIFIKIHDSQLYTVTSKQVTFSWMQI